MKVKVYQSRLGLELAMATLCALAVGMLMFFILRGFIYDELDRVLWEEESILRQEQKYVDGLQQYVSENNLSTWDGAELDHWTNTKRNFLVTLYENEKIVYSSNRQAIAPLEEDSNWLFDNMLEESGYQIVFSDCTVKAVLVYLFESYYYYSITDGFCVTISFIFFIGILFWFIRKKLAYISLLENELKILKGGDLEYVVTVQGKDELASLAGEIDSMRCAVLERQSKEEAALEANRDLVTAMSHDLRTPLTSLIGYMDILNLDTTMQPEQKRYIEAARNKAYQMKALSDKLFEYFIVYGKTQDKLCFQQVNGAELVGQFVEESLFDMESSGFQVNRNVSEVSCQVEIDVDFIRRVFGNIFSNLLKYADHAYPVNVAYGQKDGWLFIQFENHIVSGISGKESSHIGLKTCERVMKNHQGKFLSEKDGQLFRIALSFPVLK